MQPFWNKVIDEASLKNVRICKLLYTHTSHLVRSGLSLNIVGKLLVHTPAAMTQRYAHLALEPLREATKVFSKNISVEIFFTPLGKFYL